MPRLANQTGRVELYQSREMELLLQAIDAKTPAGQWAYKILSLFSGRRAGKTTFGGHLTMRKARRPDQLIWACGATYRDCHDVIIPELFRWTPQSWIADWSESNYEMQLINRTRLQIRSLEDPDTARGPGLDFAWLDEARKIQYLAWQTMSPALSDKHGQALFTTTPNAYDWCYENLWLPAEAGTPGFWACKYKTADAPHWRTPEGRAELEFRRATMDPLFFQQEYEADFVSFTGAVYGRVWSPDLILRSDEQIRRVLPEWPNIDPRRQCLIGLDPGVDHPFAGVLAVVTDKGIVVIGEYLERNRAIMDIVQGLSGICSRDNPLQPFQPEQWAIDKTQKIWAMEMSLYGLPIVPANNDVIGGINRVMAWMRTKQIFFIESRCPRLIKALQGYQWEENESKDGQATREKVKKINDDLPDALRYMLMLYPEVPEVDVVTLSKRAEQIAKFSEEQRWAIERNRRCEKLIPRWNQSDDDYGLTLWGADEELEPWGQSEFGIWMPQLEMPMELFFA